MSRSRWLNNANRFWARVEIKDLLECWEWKAGATAGYGSVSWKGKPQYTHRVAYTLTYGKIPKNMVVCHSCDNKSCCNPSHLHLGTARENVMEAIERGIQKIPRSGSGELNPHSRLTDEIVTEMRNLYSKGNTSYRRLAKQHGVCYSTAYAAIKGYSWKHLELAMESQED